MWFVCQWCSGRIKVNLYYFSFRVLDSRNMSNQKTDISLDIFHFSWHKSLAGFFQTYVKATDLCRFFCDLCMDWTYSIWLLYEDSRNMYACKRPDCIKVFKLSLQHSKLKKQSVQFSTLAEAVGDQWADGGGLGISGWMDSRQVVGLVDRQCGDWWCGEKLKKQIQR